MPKLQVNEVLNATTTTDCECSSNDPTRPCVSDDIIDIFDKIFHTNDINEIKTMTHCKSEACILKSSKVRAAIPRERINQELSTNFKVEGPRDNTNLLNNVVIDNTLKLWVQEFPDFFPCHFAMMDFKQTQEEFETIDLCKVFESGKKIFACVLNTDVSSGPGKHWVSVVVNARNLSNIQIMYYNSAGNPPPKPVVEWMERRRHELKKLGKPDVIPITRVRHQKSDTECGVYSLYFIRCCLDGVEPSFFFDNVISDEAMMEFRKHCFRQS